MRSATVHVSNRSSRNSFIDVLTRPGDAVYDPFAGRGTTPLQAALMGCRPVGNDINPLSEMLVRPRLEPVSLHAVAKRLQ